MTPCPEHPHAAACLCLPPPRIAEIRRRLGVLDVERAALASELDAFRFKCPTCRCRVLPGVPCSCCAEPCIDLDDTTEHRP